MIELACRDCVFHFNKKHLEDPTIPMWVIKAKGKTYYCDHVSANIPWTTKETPGNKHTKGSIKFKYVLLQIDDDNCATLAALSASDMARLRAKENGYTRIIITMRDKVLNFLKNHDIAFTPFKTLHGSCGTAYWICDIKKSSDITMMKLGLSNGYRILQENEPYYKAYDDPELLNRLDADDYYDEDYDENDDDDTEKVPITYEDLYIS